MPRRAASKTRRASYVVAIKPWKGGAMSSTLSSDIVNENSVGDERMGSSERGEVGERQVA